MIVTILWEDARGILAKGFGAHTLLLACLVDLGVAREDLPRIEAHAKKGNSNVRKALRTDGARLAKAGPVYAVLDRDKIRELWKPGPMPADCKQAIAEQFKLDAPGEYDLVFLEQNIESLLRAALESMASEVPEAPWKPNPDERDRILSRVAWATARERDEVRRRCPSFDRLVTRVAAKLRPVVAARGR